jgi:glycosyltransferase involved in cell wall biosynthesis
MSAVHVAILTPGFAIDDRDTNCVPALQDYLLGLRQRFPEFRLTIFTLRYPYTRASYEWHGMPVKPANGRQLPFPASLLSWGRLARDFAVTMRRTPVHIVHSFWLGECAFLGERLSRVYRLPHVVTLMGQEVARRNRYASLLRSKRTVFVAVSPFQRRELTKHTGYDVRHVIPWGFDAPSLEDSVRDIDVLGVGSLTEVKAFDAFLDVAARLPKVSCRIAGDGPLQPALEEKAARLGLDVTFEGRLSRERVLELMGRSKVLLHTSTFESFGLVFAEALACGMRIVSRPVGIAEASERWAICNSPEEMAAAVDKLLRAESFTPQHAFPLENTVRAYHELYRSLR